MQGRCLTLAARLAEFHCYSGFITQFKSAVSKVYERVTLLPDINHCGCPTRVLSARFLISLVPKHV